MRYLVALMVVAAATSAHAGWVDNILNGVDNIVNGVASMFESYEEAPYTVSAIHSGYQERVYPSRKWVCTSTTAHHDDDDATSGLFWRLFQYIDGTNSRSQKIPMTVPVSTEYTAGTTTNTYQMCFYIGAEHQDNPPTPTNTQVTIVTRPQMTVLTRTVGGRFNNDEEWLQEATRLSGVIQANGETVTLNHMYWVGYDAPYKLFGRRNEVWFPKN